MTPPDHFDRNAVALPVDWLARKPFEELSAEERIVYVQEFVATAIAIAAEASEHLPTEVDNTPTFRDLASTLKMDINRPWAEVVAALKAAGIHPQNEAEEEEPAEMSDTDVRALLEAAGWGVEETPGEFDGEGDLTSEQCATLGIQPLAGEAPDAVKEAPDAVEKATEGTGRRLKRTPGGGIDFGALGKRLGLGGGKGK